MTTFYSRVILGAFALALLVFGAFHLWQGHKNRQLATATAEASKDEKIVIASTAEGITYDKVVEAAQPQLETDKAVSLSDDAAVAQREAAVERLRPANPRHDPAPAPGNPDPDPVPPPVDLAALDAAKDELIKAQAKQHADDVLQIQHLNGQVLNLTHDRDSWRTAAQASAQEMIQKDAVIAAQKGLIEGALWKGRLQGALIGAGIGYAKGRM